MVLDVDLDQAVAGAVRHGREPVPLEQLPVWGGQSHETRDPGEDGPGVAELLRGLNAEQRRAVTHGEGPLLVVAGAGTGKTQVITRRIAWLVGTKRARPSEILALTFTDKAAEEMQLRVDQLVPYGYTDAAIATFHAFGDRLIREHALELGLPTDVRVLSRPEVVIFLREHLFDFELDEYRPLGDPTRFLGAIASYFSRLKDEDISPNAYLAYAAALRDEAERTATRLASDPEASDAERDAADAAAQEARRQLELARAFGRYQELLAGAGFLDFGDQVALALRLLRESPAARTAIQGRFRYVLVDEFQDTNRAQGELVALIAERHRNVTVVGDDDQAIYAFRGAAVSNILDFRERYRGARTVVLTRNYRSLAPVLDAAYRLVRHNDPDRLEVRVGIAKRLRPERAHDDSPPVRLEAFGSGAEEADWIAADIRARVASGARPADAAVLVRTNAAADPIIRSLNVAGIPWRFSGTSGLYTRPEVRLLLAFLRAVADLASSVDVYALAASDVYGLRGPDLVAIASMARRRNRSLWEVLDELDRQPGILRLSQDSRAAASRLTSDLRRFVELSQQRPAGEVLYAFLKSSGLLARWASADTAAAEEALGNAARFFDIVRAQSALLPDDRVPFIARHLATLIDAGDDPATADLDPDVDAVAVLTVHKAKGLEFPVVYLPGLVAGRFPATDRGAALRVPDALVRSAGADRMSPDDERLREERRLFHVGMTRARDQLVLTYAADYGGGRARRVSPFVLEALDLTDGRLPGDRDGVRGHLERLSSFEPVAPVPESPRPPRDEPMTLSFSAIDAYLTCPARYRFGHVVRVPLPPHHALVYGSALHAAVQEFHRRHARGDVMTEQELVAAFERAWTNEGFLSRSHEEARLDAGRRALLRFRTEQLEPGAVVPAYVEREFSFALDGDRIRGRWDRVDIEPLDEASVATGAADAAEPRQAFPDDRTPTAGLDHVMPTLALTGRERVTITDYKSSDVRDPVKARQRARDSLQLQIYALGYEATTGRLPDYVQLQFLESGLIGRAEVDPKRLARARERIRKAATGIREGRFEATPDTVSCSYCPYRDICPASLAR
ncbi:MAG TPA: ATP-dependent DNA helicase [Candidatus Limnocylindrales bacterium]|nr:ATP-dependent DNA helicase [Candidatus Limnocylindrales bacterium]